MEPRPAVASPRIATSDERIMCRPRDRVTMAPLHGDWSELRVWDDAGEPALTLQLPTRHVTAPLVARIQLFAQAVREAEARGTGRGLVERAPSLLDDDLPMTPGPQLMR